MIIGQAPGVTEVAAGRPFNAGSGKRLLGWLREAGFGETDFRKKQYMTAVTKCFPGKAKGGSGDRVASRVEQALCRPFLDAELALIKPDLVLPIGRLAIDLFFPKGTPLGEIIGTEIQENGRWILPLPHPSGASRWHQIPDNRRRIQLAIDKLRSRRIQLGLD
jgi:uracil-DNA glycosylase